MPTLLYWITSSLNICVQFFKVHSFFFWFFLVQNTFKKKKKTLCHHLNFNHSNFCISTAKCKMGKKKKEKKLPKSGFYARHFNSKTLVQENVALKIIV